MPELYSPGAIKAMERRRTMLRTAFGTSIAEALDDPAVIEVMVNPDGRLWLDKAGEGRIDTGEHIGWSEAERVIRLVASHIRTEVHAQAPTRALRRSDNRPVQPISAPRPCQQNSTTPLEVTEAPSLVSFHQESDTAKPR